MSTSFAPKGLHELALCPEILLDFVFASVEDTAKTVAVGFAL
jgi:hypothetical protein